MFFRIFITTVLAASGCLCANASKSKPVRRNYRSSLPPHVKPTTKCDISTAEQQQQLVTLITEAQTMLGEVAPSIEQNSPAFLAFMGKDPTDNNGFHSRVQARLEQMAEIASDRNPLIVDCPYQMNCQGKTAFALRDDDGNRVIGLCPDLLNTGTNNRKGFRNFGDIVKEDAANVCDENAAKWKRMDRLSKIRAGVFIHELAHLEWNDGQIEIPGTTDCVYGAFWSNYLARNMPNAAANNADNYLYLTTSAYLNNYCASRKATPSPARQDIYAFEITPVFKSNSLPPAGGFKLKDGTIIPSRPPRGPIGPTSPSGEPWTPEPNMQPMGFFDEEGASERCKNKDFAKLHSGLPTRKEEIDKTLMEQIEG